MAKEKLTRKEKQEAAHKRKEDLKAAKQAKKERAAAIKAERKSNRKKRTASSADASADAAADDKVRKPLHTAKSPKIGRPSRVGNSTDSKKTRRKGSKSAWAEMKAEKKKNKARSKIASYEDLDRKKRKPLNNTELSYFCGQMALILTAGISSLEGIEMMEKDFSSREDQELLLDIYDAMSETGELYSSLEQTGVFPNYMVNMIRIGEETGNLDDVMSALEIYYEREEQLRKSIQSAVFYPLIMSGMIVAVITVLLIFVMPLFNQVFKQLGTEMTGFAGFLMNLSDIINRYAIVFAGILVFILLFILFCVKTKAGRAFSNSFMKLFRPFRELKEQIASCRFADGLALVLHSGLSPDRGFQLVYDLNEDKDYARKLRRCAKYMNENGDSLAEAINRAGVFSGVYSRLTSLGSKTGSLDGSMRQVATLYQEEIDAKITNYLSMLEPALIVVLSFVVGAILISVMFPLLGIMATI